MVINQSDLRVFFDTRLHAFQEGERNGSFSHAEFLVREAFVAFPTGATSQQIRKHLGWSINRITGRIINLIEKDELVYLGIDHNSFGKPKEVLAWVGYYPDLKGNAKKRLLAKRYARNLRVLEKFSAGSHPTPTPLSSLLVGDSITAFRGED